MGRYAKSQSASAEMRACCGMVRTFGWMKAASMRAP